MVCTASFCVLIFCTHTKKEGFKSIHVTIAGSMCQCFKCEHMKNPKRSPDWKGVMYSLQIQDVEHKYVYIGTLLVCTTGDTNVCESQSNQDSCGSVPWDITPTKRNYSERKHDEYSSCLSYFQILRIALSVSVLCLSICSVCQRTLW